MKGRMSQSVSALVLWPVNLQSHPINYTYYIKKYIHGYIYYIQQSIDEKEHELFGFCRAKLDPVHLWTLVWFCRISCKEEENFLWFYEKDCFIRLSLSPFQGLFYSPLCQNQSIKCFTVHSHFVCVKCIFFSFYVKGCVFIAI